MPAIYTLQHLTQSAQGKGPGLREEKAQRPMGPLGLTQPQPRPQTLLGSRGLGPVPGHKNVEPGPGRTQGTPDLLARSAFWLGLLIDMLTLAAISATLARLKSARCQIVRQEEVLLLLSFSSGSLKVSPLHPTNKITPRFSFLATCLPLVEITD